MATRTHRLCLPVCLVVYLASSVTSSDVYFTAQPSSFHPLLTDVLTLRCSLKDSPASHVIGKRQTSSDVISDTSPSDVSFVQTIVISKAGVELATVSEHLLAHVFDNSSGVQVTGQVPGTGEEKGFLQVSWKYPSYDQSGSFKCEIRGMNQFGHVKTFSQSLDIAETEASLSDIVEYIHQLKQTNDKQSATIAALSSNSNTGGASNAALNSTIESMIVKMNDMNSTIAALTTSNSNMKSQLNNLKTTNSDLQGQVNALKTSYAELKTKQDATVIFTAMVGSKVTVSKDDVVVYNKVVTNVGNGYNPSTGVFTSPLKGYFMFHVHLEGQEDKEAQVCIYHNSRCVAHVYVEDQYGWQSASNSVSLLLQPGDTVKVVGDRYQAYLHDYDENSFSGHLLAHL